MDNITIKDLLVTAGLNDYVFTGQDGSTTSLYDYMVRREELTEEELADIEYMADKVAIWAEMFLGVPYENSPIWDLDN